MFALHINRHRRTITSPTAALRDYVHQLPHEQQREFIAAARQLIANRSPHDEVEAQPVPRMVWPQSLA